MWPRSKEAARRQKFRTVCDAMLDLLKNPGLWKATRSREERYTFSVEAFSLDRLDACPDCGPRPT